MLKSDTNQSNGETSQRPSTSSSIAPSQFVRTDPKVQKLDKFLLSSTPDPNTSRMKTFQDSPSRIEISNAASSNTILNGSITTKSNPAAGNAAGAGGSQNESAKSNRYSIFENEFLLITDYIL